MIPSRIFDCGSIHDSLHPSKLSGRNDTKTNLISISESSDSQLYQSIHFKTPKRHFAIENEVYN